MKEHRLSPMREEPLSAPVSEEGSQSVGAGAAGPPGTVGSAGSNKKPRSRTKVHDILLFSLFRTFIGTDKVIIIHLRIFSIYAFILNPGFVHSRFPWRPWESCRASSRMLDFTQTRRPSTLCQHSSTFPNTPSSSSSRTSGTMLSTTAGSKSWVKVLPPAEVWTSVNTEKRSCFQGQRTQSPARTELRRSSSPQRGAVGVRGDWPSLQPPPAPTPASCPQGPTLLRRRVRTRAMADLVALWPPAALHPVLESRLTTRGRDWHTGRRGQRKTEGREKKRQ